jgi:predicted Zn-dependent protease
MEPPPWYFPTRQALGAVLLDAKRSKDAEAVYRTDLEQYPRNGWSLHGLARSLREQGKRAEAEWAQQGFANAWARADVALTASRF